ncbi:uncharacterized protein PHACADRAFT_134164 [Phanerochaete carnosa HHB-10118-sp]|uniref:Transmembrane protein 135 N-terminal domain-containing protein n=1 Tax=Phanerochaete carnosa (strain HHB-10118-sp) TaxID=650164 RepID=K5WAR5_PHACS|nr:uncharacterized protein PHACADRAFT_134164 [Phanerochaete carnosa HHB-10118-sp]EKM61043.1 hypothetical protein PHACADRAFT_134164 [Phanerochaete carnosa HHB-10118-sp]
MASTSSLRWWSHYVAEQLHTFSDDHPLQIALRTYSLALSLSLSPVLAGFLAKPRRSGAAQLLRALRRELGFTGFASAFTVAIAGGAALRSLLAYLEKEQQGILPLRAKTFLSRLKDVHKTFSANALSAYIAIALLQHRRSRPSTPSTHRSSGITPIQRSSPTIDLTLLVLVRALDSVVRSVLFSHSTTQDVLSSGELKRAENRRRTLSARLDAMVFWASSARIMWCFFYEPQRLPRSYNTWIMTLANIDPRILGALRAIREGRWSYVRRIAVPSDLLSSLSRDLGYPESWGSVTRLPAFGGPAANGAWKTLAVSNRPNLGGIPCELVHGGIGGGSCAASAALRSGKAFAEAMLIYLPVHVLPILLYRPRKLTRVHNIMNTLLSVTRSATFLSSFVSSIWVAVCLTRTLLLARLFPWISHDFWDGPHGCAFLGTLVCGGSIWIEQGRRRGEMALYVLPKAIRACLPEAFLRSGLRVQLLERLVFVASLATLLTKFVHDTSSLRGLPRWALTFVMNGSNAGFWKKKRQDTSDSPPPRTPYTI